MRRPRVRTVSAEYRLVPAQLARPAARQDGKHRLVGREAMSLAEVRPVGLADGLLQQRMADEAGIQAHGLEIGRLEREQAEHVVEITRDLGRAPRPIGPNGRRHVVNQGKTCPLQLSRDPERKSRHVDRDKGRRPQPAGRARRGPNAPEHPWHVGDDFQKPHQRQLGIGKQALQPLLGHERAADAGETDSIARAPLERLHQAGSDEVAGRLARDQEDQRRVALHSARQLTPTKNTPCSSARATARSRSRISVSPASTATPLKPASASLSIVSAPIVGRSARRS